MFLDSQSSNQAPFKRNTWLFKSPNLILKVNVHEANSFKLVHRYNKSHSEADRDVVGAACDKRDVDTTLRWRKSAPE